jgi:predicted  nucleic acid-binding Zn-ribbon protein
LHTDDDTLDRAGHDVIAMIQQAAGMAEQHTQHVLGIAHQASMQLRVAEDKIVKLETEILAYKDRAERAEEWLRRIEQEIEKAFASRPPQQQQSQGLRRA